MEGTQVMEDMESKLMCGVHTRTMFGTSPPYMHMQLGEGF